MSLLLEDKWAVAESQRGMMQNEVKIVCQGATPWKMCIFLRGRVELFTGGWMSCCWVQKRDNTRWSEGATCNVQRATCQGATPRKTSIFLRLRVKLFRVEWVSYCWVPKRNNTENETNGYKTHKGNRKGKYKHLAWCNLMYKKDFSFSAKDL